MVGAVSTTTFCSKTLKSLAKHFDFYISKHGRIFSRMIEKVLNLKSVRETSVSLDLINFYGPKESEIAIRTYFENYSYPKRPLRMLKRYRVTLVFCEMPIRGHTINDIAFFDKPIKTKIDVEKVLVKAVYRSFLQRAERLGVQATYCNIGRVHRVFQRLFQKGNSK